MSHPWEGFQIPRKPRGASAGQVNYPLCTIAETPRLPEHCVEYAVVVLWEQRFPGQKLNRDWAGWVGQCKNAKPETVFAVFSS